MNENLSHSVERIIQQLLLDLEVGTLPEDGEDWPVYYGSLPDSPNNAIRVKGTEGRVEGRTMYDGRTQEKHGIQVLVRGDGVVTSYQKARAISRLFDEEVFRDVVTVDETEYLVEAITRTSAEIPLGYERPTSLRSRHAVNALCSITLYEPEGAGTAEEGGTGVGTGTEELETIYHITSNANALWTINDYTVMDPDVLQPTEPDIPGNIAAGGVADNGERQVYNIQSPNRTLTQIKVWLYWVKTPSPNQPTVDIKVGSNDIETPQQLVGPPGWESVTFTGSWSAAELNELFQVGITAPTLGSLGAMEVYALYCEVT